MWVNDSLSCYYMVIDVEETIHPPPCIRQIRSIRGQIESVSSVKSVGDKTFIRMAT